MYWGSYSQKKLCNGGGCERKHEVVNQTEKEQNFQGAGNTVLKRSFLEKIKKNSFLGDGQKKDKTEKEKELEEKKDCTHKASLKEVGTERGHWSELQGIENSSKS